MNKNKFAEMIDISFVVPVYNVQDYIVECIESLLDINGIYFEIIIINDGSTDESILNIQYLLDNPMIKLINQENRGLSGARNTGIRNACGRYVSFVDSDDKIDASALVSLYENGSIKFPDIIVGDYLYWTGNELIGSDRTLPSDRELNGRSLLVECYPQFIDSVTWRGLYNREYLLSHQLFFVERIFFEDMEWMPRTFYYADAISYHKIPFYHYRYRLDSITLSTFSHKKFEDCIYIASLHLSMTTAMQKDVKKIFLRNSFYCFYKAISSYPDSSIELQNRKVQSLLSCITLQGTLCMKLMAYSYKHFPQITCWAMKVMKDVVRLCHKKRR